MVSRSHRASLTPKNLVQGGPQLTLAKLIIRTEQSLKFFFQPLMIGGVFVALALLGVFSSLYPWLHLVVLAIFVSYFFRTLGRAQARWTPPSVSDAKRRVEAASNLAHRPLDVMEDRPASNDLVQASLWNIHRERTVEQTQSLDWPRWALDFTGHDRYGLRYVVLLLVILGIVFGWGALGVRMVAAINPAVGKWHIVRPALDAWITPPAYTHLPPIMIATPAGLRRDNDVIDVPEGSMLYAHLAEKSGSAPELKANNHSQTFVAEDQKDFAATTKLVSGDSISIRRGWNTIGSWRIRVVPDQSPKIAFSDAPSITERKSVRVAYHADDDYGVTDVKLRVTPRQSLPGYDNAPVDIALNTAEAKTITRADYEDLTGNVWSGLPVSLQLIASDTAGHTTTSASVDMILPERDFMHPIARALIEERRRLLQSPNDDAVRGEAANVMAGIAHQPASFGGDAVVLMALRTGAVGLVLDRTHAATPEANAILWRTALRIEDGTVRSAEDNLRQAQKDLAQALDSNASDKDIQRAVDRLHQALSAYMAQLAQQGGKRDGRQAEDLNTMLGASSHTLTPDDLQNMVESMRNALTSSARDEARQQLSKLQQLLENMHTGPVKLTAEQREALQNIKKMQAAIQAQKSLIDKTFQSGKQGNVSGQLATEQTSIQKQLREVATALKDSADTLAHSDDAMKRAVGQLRGGHTDQALESQNEALKAMQDALKDAQDDMRQSLFMMPQNGMGFAGRDPFGRDGRGMVSRDDGGIKLPDQMEIRRVREILDELQRRAGDSNRPKPERDYIDRLLQNF